MRPSTDALVKLYYDEKLLPREIAARVGGISATGVRSRLVRAGHKLRPRGNWNGNLRRPKVKTEDLLKAYRDGLNYSQIAERFHTTRPTVTYRLRRIIGLSWKHDPKISQKLPWKEIIALYEGEGLSAEKIAQRYDVGHQTINRGLHARGVEMRDKTAHAAATWAERKAKLAEAERIIAQQERAEVERISPQEHVKQPKRSPERKKKSLLARAHVRVGQEIEKLIPRFVALFGVPGKPLDSVYRRAGFKKSEIFAAQEARRSRQPAGKLPIIAARIFVAQSKNKSRKTITNQHETYVAEKSLLILPTAPETASISGS